jgi:hypothetical protein
VFPKLRPRNFAAKVQRLLPVLSGHERADGLGELLLERFELRLAGREVSGLYSHSRSS